jgi:hypothetical protein
VDSLRQAQERCTLRIITVNDVYELGNLPYLDGVIRLVKNHWMTGMGMSGGIEKVWGHDQNIEQRRQRAGRRCSNCME